MTPPLSRREVLGQTAAVAAGAFLANSVSGAGPAWTPKYLLGSCLYGYTDVREVLPEVARTGAVALDIWPKVHGNQREQLDELGEERFAALLREHRVPLGCITQYKLGPFGLQDELKLAQRLGCHTIVTGAKGPAGLSGTELKGAVAKFIEQMKPHLEAAEAAEVTIAIENHGHNLIDSADAVKWLVELRGSRRLAVALAPYHLPQDVRLLSDLIRTTGEGLAVFYAWQHGKGCMTKQPKADELLQMPGRGELEFAPLLAALRDIRYQGWTEIFMHPFPRGIPILESTAAVTAEINRARDYLQQQLPSA